ncbi:MAG: PAS domain-containing protein, partial [Anaerolineae bacterium]|nr:PAS domain-containing protein [Anaerolineae bacterium]
MSDPIHILYVDDYPFDRELVRDALEKEHEGFRVTEAASRADFEARLDEGGYDLVLSDFNILGFEGLQVLDAVFAKHPHVPVIIVTGTGSEEVAVEAMKRGAADYVIKTARHIRRLPHTIHAVMEKKQADDERKQAQEALRHSEAQLSNAMVIAKLGYWEYDVAEEMFMFNDHFYAIFHTSAEQVGGYKLSPAQYAERFLHPDDAWLVASEIKKALETTDPDYNRQLEHRIIYADGGVGYLSVRLFVMKDNQGRTIKAYGANQDITERKRSEEALRESESKYRTLVEHIPQKIFTKDKASVYVSCNENFARDLGVKPDQCAGSTDYDFFPRELADKYRADDKRIMETAQTEELEEKYLQAGQETWVQTIKTPIRQADGQVIGILGIFWDITKRIQAEAEHEKLQLQLNQAQKMESIGRLAGGIADDFNNLL